MALGLACGQGWWRSCSAAAIFPRGAGGARCGSSAPARSRGALEPGTDRPVQRMESRPRRPVRPPRPQTQKAGSLGWGLKGLRWRLFALCHLSQTENSGMRSGSLVDDFPPCLPAPLSRCFLL